MKAKKKVVKARDLCDLHCYGDWERQRGVFRVNSSNGDAFMISTDTIVEALKKSGMSFIAEQKRVHEHLKLRDINED